MMRNVALINAVMMILGALSQAHAAEPFQGFSINSEPINPVCIGKMRPWISDTGIIIKSIVLEKCQESNWGFHENPIDAKENTVSTDIEGEAFGYRVIGKTDSGLFIVHHTGNNIVAYRIDEQTVQPDLLKPKTEKVHILTVASDSFVPCFKKATVRGDRIIIEKQADDPQASHAEQCKDEMETVEYNVKP